MAGRSGDLRVVQDLAGHSTPTITAKYMHPTQEDQKKVLAGIPNLLTDDGLKLTRKLTP